MYIYVWEIGKYLAPCIVLRFRGGPKSNGERIQSEKSYGRQ